jgi:hypothetical protein
MLKYNPLLMFSLITIQLAEFLFGHRIDSEISNARILAIF